MNDLSDLCHPPPFPAVGGRGHAAAHQRAQGTPKHQPASPASSPKAAPRTPRSRCRFWQIDTSPFLVSRRDATTQTTRVLNDTLTTRTTEKRITTTINSDT
jgi:hypothetical protein